MIVHACASQVVIHFPDETSVSIAAHDHVDKVDAELTIAGLNRGSECLLNALVLPILVQSRSNEEVDVHPDRACPVVVAIHVVRIV